LNYLAVANIYLDEKIYASSVEDAQRKAQKMAEKTLTEWAKVVKEIK
jgi:formamidopyrimidine-DNA glycosylase